MDLLLIFGSGKEAWIWMDNWVYQMTLVLIQTWWRPQMETFSTLLSLCKGNPPVTSGFPSQRPVTRSFDVLRMNKRLYKQLLCRWFETPSCLSWRHCNEGLNMDEQLGVPNNLVTNTTVWSDENKCKINFPLPLITMTNDKTCIPSSRQISQMKLLFQDYFLQSAHLSNAVLIKNISYIKVMVWCQIGEH